MGVDLNGSYDSGAAPQEDFGPIPAGEYEAEIIDSNVEDLKDNKGKCLLLVWKVRSGDYTGRQIWDRMNLWFTGPEKTPGKVVQIANAQFASVREATGIKAPANSEELHNRPCIIRVAYTQDPGYAPKNEIKHVKAMGSHQPAFAQRQVPGGAPAAPAPRAAPAPAGGGAAAPWRKTA